MKSFWLSWSTSKRYFARTSLSLAKMYTTRPSNPANRAESYCTITSPLLRRTSLGFWDSVASTCFWVIPQRAWRKSAALDSSVPGCVKAGIGARNDARLAETRRCPRVFMFLTTPCQPWFYTSILPRVSLPGALPAFLRPVRFHHLARAAQGQRVRRHCVGHYRTSA